MPLCLFIAGIAGQGGLLAWAYLTGLSSLERYGLSATSNQALVFGAPFLWASIIILGLMLPRFFPGASELIVDRAGLTLVFSKRTRSRYRWEDSGSYFWLQDYSEYSAKLSGQGLYYLYGAHVWQRRSTLTPEAFEAVLSTARAWGAVESQRRGSSNWYELPPTIYKIRAGSVASAIPRAR